MTNIVQMIRDREAELALPKIIKAGRYKRRTPSGRLVDIKVRFDQSTDHAYGILVHSLGKDGCWKARGSYVDPSTIEPRT